MAQLIKINGLPASKIKVCELARLFAAIPDNRCIAFAPIPNPDELYGAAFVPARGEHRIYISNLRTKEGVSGRFEQNDFQDFSFSDIFSQEMASAFQANGFRPWGRYVYVFRQRISVDYMFVSRKKVRAS